MNKKMNFLSSFSSQLDELKSEGRFMEMSTYVLNLMVKNVDLSPMAGKIIKLLAVPYPPCKKVMYSFLTRYSANIADLNILATNTLLKDYEDPNPFIRRLVVKTVCNIPCLSDLALELMPRALSDTSSYVRCSAVTACASVIGETNIKDNQEIIDKLYEMIRDPDASVVCCSLAALDDILDFDGGIVINSRMVCYLMNRIHDFSEWNFAVVYKVLIKYTPKDTDELLKFLNALDGKLLNPNFHVSCVAAQLALHYVRKVEKDFSGDIVQQIVPQFRSFLSHSSQEIIVSTLEVIDCFISEHSRIFQPLYKLFFCCFCDTIITKVKKLKILTLLVCEENSEDIIEEILSHCCDANKEVSVQAVNSFIDVLKRHPGKGNFLNTFVSLMDLQNNDLSEDIFNALTTMDLRESPTVRDCVFAAVSNQVENLQKIESKFSLLKLIADYGKDIESSPYIIERMVNDESNLMDEKLLSCLLMTAVRLFFSRPGEMQLLLGCLLQRASESPCLLLRKQASIYNYLFKDTSNAQKCILHEFVLPVSSES